MLRIFLLWVLSVVIHAVSAGEDSSWAPGSPCPCLPLLLSKNSYHEFALSNFTRPNFPCLLQWIKKNGPLPPDCFKHIRDKVISLIYPSYRVVLIDKDTQNATELCDKDPKPNWYRLGSKGKSRRLSKKIDIPLEEMDENPCEKFTNPLKIQVELPDLGFLALVLSQTNTTSGFLDMNLFIRSPKATYYYNFWWKILARKSIMVLNGSDINILFGDEAAILPVLNANDSIQKFNSRIALNFPALEGSAFWRKNVDVLSSRADALSWRNGTMSTDIHTVSLGSIILDGTTADSVKLSFFSKFWGDYSNGIAKTYEFDVADAIRQLKIEPQVPGAPTKLSLMDLRTYNDKAISLKMTWDLPFPGHVLSSYPPKYSHFQLNCKIFSMDEKILHQYQQACRDCLDSAESIPCTKCWKDETLNTVTDFYTETAVNILGLTHRKTKLSDQRRVHRSLNEMVADFSFTQQSVPFIANVELLTNDWTWTLSKNHYWKKLWKGSGLEHYPEYLVSGLQDVGIPIYKFDYFLPKGSNDILNLLPTNTMFLPGEKPLLVGLSENEVEEVGLVCRVRAVVEDTAEYHKKRNNTFLHEPASYPIIKQSYGEWSTPLAVTTKKQKSPIAFFATTYSMEQHTNSSGKSYYSNKQNFYLIRYDPVSENFIKDQDYPLSYGDWKTLKSIFSNQFEFLQRHTLVPMRPLMDISTSSKEGGKVRKQDLYYPDLKYHPLLAPEDRDNSTWAADIPTDILVKDYFGRSFGYTEEEISMRDRVGCFHFSFNEWFVFKPNWNLSESREVTAVGQPLNETLYASSQYHLVREGHTTAWDDWYYFEETHWKHESYKTSNIPHTMRCPQLGNMLIWSEQSKKSGKNPSEVKIYRIRLHNIHGTMEERPQLFDEKKLCACSTTKKIDLPVIDILYPSLKDPYTVNLMVSCGQTLCAVNVTGSEIGSSREVLKFEDFSRGKKVKFFQIDHSYIYYMAMDSPSVFIQPRYTEGPMDTLELNQIPSSPFWYDFTMKTLPKDTENIRNYFNWIYVYKDETKLPVMPSTCLKFLNPDSIKIRMTSDNTASIELKNLWETPPGCENFAVPNKTYEIRYGQISEFNTTDSSQDFSCESLSASDFGSNTTKVLSCKKVDDLNSSLPTATTSFTNLQRQSVYLIEIGVYPKLPSKLAKVWLSGNHDIQPHKVIFHTSSKQPTSSGLQNSNTNGWLVLIDLLLILLCGIISYLVWKHYTAIVLDKLASQDIKLGGKIAEGAYGDICKASLKKFAREPIEIVVKTLRPSATGDEQAKFFEEAFIVSKMASPCIIDVVGICLQTKPKMLAFEFMSAGSLSKYLQDPLMQKLLVGCDLLKMSQDALEACIYLESHGIIHRDIGARNCLVKRIQRLKRPPQIVLKLADLGEAKDVGNGGKLAHFEHSLQLQWTAPEAMKENNIFSTKSDVWSYGVLIWEIFTWAATPYGKCSVAPEFHHTPCTEVDISHDALKEKITGPDMYNLLTHPDPCVSNLSTPLKTEFLVHCWKYNPDLRPSFKELKSMLRRMIVKMLGF